LAHARHSHEGNPPSADGQPLADYSSYLDSAGGSSTFGEIISPVNVRPVGSGAPRQIQFLLRVDF
jgi:hypothetical protein